MFEVAKHNGIVIEFIQEYQTIGNFLKKAPMLIHHVSPEIAKKHNMLELVGHTNASTIIKMTEPIRNRHSLAFFKLMHETGVPIKIQETQLNFKYDNESWNRQEATSIKDDRDKLFYIFSNCDYNFKSNAIPKKEYMVNFVKADDSEMVRLLLQNSFLSPRHIKPMVELAQKNNAFKVLPLLLAYIRK